MTTAAKEKTNETELLIQLIQEAIKSIMEQNAISAGAVAGTSGSPLGMKPRIFDPEKPKSSKKRKTKKNI